MSGQAKSVSNRENGRCTTPEHFGILAILLENKRISLAAVYLLGCKHLDLLLLRYVTLPEWALATIRGEEVYPVLKGKLFTDERH